MMLVLLFALLSYLLLLYSQILSPLLLRSMFWLAIQIRIHSFDLSRIICAALLLLFPLLFAKLLFLTAELVSKLVERFPRVFVIKGDCLVCYEGVSTARFGWMGGGGDGTKFGCREQHWFCSGCFKDFLKGVLKDAKKGVKVFPVVCPVCKGGSHISSSKARTALDENEMILWTTQKHLDATPHLLCPQPDCQGIIVKPFSFLRAYCPRDLNCSSCRRLVCINCESASHKAEITCKEFKAWKRAKDQDDLFVDFAVSRQLRQCTRCKMVIERNQGCSHMTCRCGHAFCYEITLDPAGVVSTSSTSSLPSPLRSAFLPRHESAQKTLAGIAEPRGCLRLRNP
ncbi:hypothetical protein BDY24DRAFT_413497 [Mrakia frigida]|uniref:BRcat and Rcat domain-containing protein n=1 Tax=Mrakia frigida TaxID=29902 RepID=UPI003FCC09EF